jgi:hypothetical protein
MKLYYHPLSGHSHRARLFLSLTGTPHELIEVDLAAKEHKRPDFLRLNAFGEIPVLDDGGPIPDVKYPYGRWERTLKRLRIRYRRPYVARHTSVSWSLMMGRNPLLIAKEHGHRILTMLTVYAAWTEGAVEADFWAIQDALYRTDLDTLRHRSVTPRAAPSITPAAEPEPSEPEPTGAPRRASRQHDAGAGGENDGFSTEYGTPEVADLLKCLTALRNLGGADGTLKGPVR